MAESLLVRKGGGLKIDESLQNFTVASGQTITKGTFVDSQDLDTLSNELTYSTPGIQSFTYYQDNQVLVYRIGLGFSICTVTDTSITFGSNFQEISGLNSIKISKIEGNRFFITYEQNFNSSFARILDVGTQTLGAAVQLLGASTTRVHTHDIISSTKAVVGYQESNNPTYIRIANLSGTTITLSPAVTVASSNNGRLTVKLVNGFIVTAWRNSSTGTLTTSSYSESSGTLTIISNSIVLSGSSLDTFTDTDESSFQTSSVIHPLTSTLFIILYRSSNSVFRSVVMSINSGGTIAYGTQNNSIITSFDAAARIKNIQNNLFVTWYHTGNAYQSSIRFFDIDLTGVITLGNVVNFNHGNETQQVRITKLQNRALVAYMKQTAGQFARSFFKQKLVTNATGEKVFGLAKTDGTAGQTVEVFVNT
jgi:hypothetical protein